MILCWPHPHSLFFQQKNGYEQLQVVTYGEKNRHNKGRLCRSKGIRELWSESQLHPLFYFMSLRKLGSLSEPQFPCREMGTI